MGVLKMNWLKRCCLHFKTICVHKWWVFYYSRYLGIPFRGFFHDFSKFSPVEFFESARFYTGVSSPINEAKAANGISYAWQHHKGRNPHHYEYWTDKYDTGTVALKMPFKYVLELVADYMAAGRTYNSAGFTYEREYEWWQTHKDEKFMHPETKRLVSAIFDLIKQDGLSFGDFSTKNKIKHDLMEKEFKDY